MGNHFQLKNGSYFISTEAPGGIYNSNQLKLIASLCEQDAAIVKATEDQRLALFLSKDQIDDVAAKMKAVGLGIRHYQDGLHQPVSCIGELCPSFEQDALGTAMEMNGELSRINLDSPLKIGINGCSRCCVPTHTLDISVIGETNGYRVFFGGKNSQIPEMASYLAEGVPATELPTLLIRVIELYKKNAEQGESLQELIERIGGKLFVDALAPYSQDSAAAGGDFGFGESVAPGAAEDNSQDIEVMSDESLDDNLHNIEDDSGSEDLATTGLDSENNGIEDDLLGLMDGDDAALMTETGGLNADVDDVQSIVEDTEAVSALAMDDEIAIDDSANVNLDELAGDISLGSTIDDVALNDDIMIHEQPTNAMDTTSDDILEDEIAGMSDGDSGSEMSNASTIESLDDLQEDIVLEKDPISEAGDEISELDGMDGFEQEQAVNAAVHSPDQMLQDVSSEIELDEMITDSADENAAALADLSADAPVAAANAKNIGVVAAVAASSNVAVANDANSSDANTEDYDELDEADVDAFEDKLNSEIKVAASMPDDEDTSMLERQEAMDLLENGVDEDVMEDASDSFDADAVADSSMTGSDDVRTLTSPAKMQTSSPKPSSANGNERKQSAAFLQWQLKGFNIDHQGNLSMEFSNGADLQFNAGELSDGEERVFHLGNMVVSISRFDSGVIVNAGGMRLKLPFGDVRSQNAAA